MLAALLVLGSMASAGPAAQDPAPRREPLARADAARVEEVRAELASSDAATCAWGAWHAGEEELVPLAGAIAERVRAWRSAPASKEQVWVLRSLTDALVRLDARLPAADVEGLEARFGVLRPQVLVLASRAPAANAALLERLYGSARDEAWIAAVNLLGAAAPERVAPKLVSDVTIAVRVDVHDRASGAAGGGSRTSGIGCGALEAPERFPPTVLYALHARARKAPAAEEGVGGARAARAPSLAEYPRDVFAPGPTAIGYERTVRRERSFGVGGRVEPIDRSGYALRALRWIADGAGALVEEPDGARSERRLASRITIDHAWRDAATYLAEVGAELDAYDALWKELLGALCSRGAIDAEVATTRAPFAIDVHDRRSGEVDDLPALPPS